ncbi:hypothetical protein CPB85DRAFT_1254212 [Mucidula mucida]|nr:hypothetical protein CPB85DRAFT_1254212 [Mucidula mucida]
MSRPLPLVALIFDWTSWTRLKSKPRSGSRFVAKILFDNPWSKNTYPGRCRDIGDMQLNLLQAASFCVNTTELNLKHEQRCDDARPHMMSQAVRMIWRDRVWRMTYTRIDDTIVWARDVERPVICTSVWTVSRCLRQAAQSFSDHHVIFARAKSAHMHYTSTHKRHSHTHPNFIKLAQAMGVYATRCTTVEELQAKFLEYDGSKPVLMECVMEKNEHVFPNDESL